MELEGELHDDFWGSLKLLEGLAHVNPTLALLAEARSSEPTPLTLGNVLKGEQWGRLFLELTGRCNENCLHCYASSSPTVEEALDSEEIQGVLREAAALGFRRVQLTGGDPLISPALVSAISLARDLGFREVEVYTNGLAFRDELAEHFARHQVKMALSVYSHLPEVHDRVTRTPGSHVRTCNAIRLALRHGISVRVAGIQGCDPEQDEQALRDFLVKLGLSSEAIAADRQRPVGRGTWNSQTRLLDQSGGAHAASRMPVAGKLCITYSGQVVPCIFDRRLVLGSIREESISEIFARPLRLGVGSRSGLPVVGEPLACGDCRTRHELLQGSRWQ